MSGYALTCFAGSAGACSAAGLPERSDGFEEHGSSGADPGAAPQTIQAGFLLVQPAKGSRLPFLALVEHTNFIPPEEYGGDHLIYCGDYLEPDHEYFNLSKEELLERFLPSLRRFNPDFRPEWVRDSWLFRTPYAQPVPLTGHSRNIPDIRTPLDGLFFASMSQVYPWDRGTNFAVQIARKAARLMMEDGKKKQ